MTYSIVAADPRTGELGVAVQSHWFSVGGLVTWAEPGIGAVATQANVDAGYGALLGSWGGGMVIGGLAFAALRRTELRILLPASTLAIGCAYLATVGSPTVDAVPPGGQVHVASHPTNVNGVRVRTANDAGASLDRPFHIGVIC